MKALKLLFEAIFKDNQCQITQQASEVRTQFLDVLLPNWIILKRGREVT